MKHEGNVATAVCKQTPPIKTLRYALPAFLLVGRTAGVPEQDLLDQWRLGDRETAIELATAPAPKVRRGK